MGDMTDLTSSPSSSVTSSKMEEVRDLLIDLSMNTYIVAKREKQQEREANISPLNESAITPPSHYRLKAGIVRKALHAFAVIFTFDNSGDQVTATMLREEVDCFNDSSQVTVYIAKNSGTSTRDNNLGKVLSAYFKNMGAKIRKRDTNPIFRHFSLERNKDIAHRFEALKSAQETLSHQPEEYSQWAHVSTGIAELLGCILKYHSGVVTEEQMARDITMDYRLKPDAPKRQLELFRSISNWVKRNKTDIEAFRGFLNRSVFTSNIKCVKESLGLLEDLCRLHNSLEDLEKFRTELGRHSTLLISFVQPQNSNHSSIDTEMRKKLDRLRSENPKAGLPCSPEPRAQLDIHCEIQLLTHFHAVLNKQEQEQEQKANMWKYIACSKLPCYCCYHFLKTGSEFSTEESHYAVYWPWAIPKELADEACSQLKEGNPVITNSLGNIRDKFGIRITRACKGEPWEQGERIDQKSHIYGITNEE